MKKIFLAMAVLMISALAFAQSTEILPGIVLPQMTTTQRNQIASPKNGMLVFDTNTQSYWYRQSGAWVELPKGGSTNNYWKLEGTGGNVIKNTNSGGFWSENAVGLNANSNDTSNPPTAPVSGDGTRLMWIPSRSAFRVGTVTENSQSWDASNIGRFSFASGVNTKASGVASTAMGYQTEASGYISTAMGWATTASKDYSTAMGYYTTASGYASTAMGYYTTASGYASTAMGKGTEASGAFSTAMGESTKASGAFSTAMGEYTKASGEYSTAMGWGTEASGKYSTAMAVSTKASGEHSTAMGLGTEASGETSTAMGESTKASGDYSTAMGSSTTASGPFSTAMGYQTEASGKYSTAMGYNTKASKNYSTAMGSGTTASGQTSTAIGRNTLASGSNSTAMGIFTTASGDGSTAMGTFTTAPGDYSTAMGYNSHAKADYSLVYGNNIGLNSTATGSIFLGDGTDRTSTWYKTGSNRFYAVFDNGYVFNTDGTTNSTTGVLMGHGANSWSTISDSTKKENFKPIDKTELLDGVRNLKLGTWNYKGQNPAEYRHYGPMAQEFYHYFGKDELGVIGNDTLIASADIDGVMMTAIQALIEENDRLKADNLALKEENLSTRSKIADLENAVFHIQAMLNNKEIIKTEE